MVLRRLPRALGASPLALPILITVGCSSAPPAEDPTVKTYVFRKPDGRCFESSSSTCPEGAYCNPPPPEAVLCPTAPGALESDYWRPEVGRLEDGRCGQTTPPTCGTDREVPCTPGPVEIVPCPPRKSWVFDRYKAPPVGEHARTPKGELARNPDGTCTVIFHDNCPENVKCNPPSPRKVACPEDPAPK